MRPLTHALLAAAALVASVSATPRPAEAQTVIRVCLVNQSGMILRSRFTYTDWQSTRHTSQWKVTALGQRVCGTLQDLGSLSIEVEGNVAVWSRLSGCDRTYTVSDPKRSANLFVTGTGYRNTCTLEQ